MKWVNQISQFYIKSCHSVLIDIIYCDLTCIYNKFISQLDLFYTFHINFDKSIEFLEILNKINI